MVCSADAPPDELFIGGGGGGGGDKDGSGGGGGSFMDPDAAGFLDLESLQFEGEAEGARLRRDVMAEGGVAPVASSVETMKGALAQLSGLEERFAFKRAVSRLLEMQTPAYVRDRV